MQDIISRCKKVLIAYWPYALITLAILGPLLKPGYALTLDMVFAPHIGVLELTNPNFLVSAVLHVLNMLLPADLIQKLLLLTILIGSGIGMHRLTRSLQEPSESQVATYLSGVFYMVNPFVYSRFMAGQYYVLLAYAILPFYIRSVVLFIHKPAKKQALWLLMWLVLLSVTSIHMLGIALIPTVFLVAKELYTRKQDKQWLRSVFAWAAAIAVLFIVASSYWLVPFVSHSSASAQLVSGFTGADRNVFATNGQQLGVLGNVFALHGFWGDAKNLYVTPQEAVAWWFVPLIILLVLIITGIYTSFTKQRAITIALVGTMLIGAVLASGSHGTIFASLNTYLVDHVPFFNGYREPQKFVVLIALAYAYFAGIGLAAIATAMQQRNRLEEWTIIVLAVGFVAPFLYASYMLWGFHSQLRASQYPKDWYTVNERFKADPSVKAVFLPWHQYMRYDFAGRIISSPADKFFDASMITSNNPEMNNIKGWQNSRDETLVEDTILPQAFAGKSTVGYMLRERGIRYVLLAKEYDYTKYSFLDKQPGLVLVQDLPTLKLYEVR